METVSNLEGNPIGEFHIDEGQAKEKNKETFKQSKGPLESIKLFFPVTLPQSWLTCIKGVPLDKMTIKKDRVSVTKGDSAFKDLVIKNKIYFFWEFDIK